MILMASSASVQAESLENTIISTLQSNPDVRVAISERRVVDEELRRSYSGYLPTVDFNVAYGYESSNNPTTRSAAGPDNVDEMRTDLALNVRQMLFDGNAVSSDVKLQKARLNAAAHRVRESAENTALRVAEVYIEVLRRQILVTLAEDNVQKHIETLEQIRKRADGGAGSQADVTQTTGRLALARSSLVAAKGNLLTAKDNYIRVVGAAPQALVDPFPPEERILENLESVLETAMQRNATINAAQSDILATKAQQESAKAPFYPRFDLELGHTNNHNVDAVVGTNKDVVAQVRMSYNLFRGGADSARLSETARRVNSAKENLDRSKRQIEETARISWDGLMIARERIGFLKAHRDASAEVLDSYKQQLKIGQRTLLDVLDSENELFNARSNYEIGRYTLILSTYQVLNSYGDLLYSLQIPQPEATKLLAGDVGLKDYLPVVEFPDL